MWWGWGFAPHLLTVLPVPHPCALLSPTTCVVLRLRKGRLMTVSFKGQSRLTSDKVSPAPGGQQRWREPPGAGLWAASSPSPWGTAEHPAPGEALAPTHKPVSSLLPPWGRANTAAIAPKRMNIPLAISLQLLSGVWWGLCSHCLVGH